MLIFVSHTYQLIEYKNFLDVITAKESEHMKNGVGLLDSCWTRTWDWDWDWEPNSLFGQWLCCGLADAVGGGWWMVEHLSLGYCFSHIYSPRVFGTLNFEPANQQNQ